MNYSFLRFAFLAIICLVLTPCISQTQLFLESMPGYQSNEKISDLYIDNKNVIWVASAKGLSSISEQSSEPNRSNIKKEVCALEISKSGKKYIGYVDNSVYADDQEIYQLNKDNANITDIEIHGQNLYVASTNGLYIFDLLSNKLKQHLTERNSKLRSNYINFVLSDSRGRLWIGTKNGIALQKKSSSSLDKTYDSKLNYIAACENEEGVWLISDQVMWLVESTDFRWVDVGLKKGLYSGEINDIAVDLDGSIYIASDILVKFDPYQNLTEQYSDILGIASKKCLALECDKENIIWLGTSDAGLFKIFKEKKEPTKKKKEDDLTEAPVAELRLTSIIENNVACPGDSNGKIRVSINGGQEPYNTVWEPGYIKGLNPDNLKAGTYTITVTDKLNTVITKEIEILEPTEIQAEIAEVNRVSSNYKKDGYCKLQINGGISPYTIAWDNGEEGFIAKKLSAGIHSVRISDAKGCQSIIEVDVKKPKNIPELEREKIVVGQTMRINKLFFQADSSTISINSYDVLDEIYDFLNENPDIVIEIGGHTNNIPPHEYCDNLSQERAEEVADYLFSKGIDGEKVTAKGYGKRNPIASNESAAGRKKNQRVEIKILKIAP